MHYAIGLITAIAGLIFAVHRLQQAGLDLNALNPFLWYRRRQWAKKYAAKPLYCVDKPMDLAALLLLATAKCEGEVSAEQKSLLINVFKAEFHLDAKGAEDLLVASAYLLRDEMEIASQLDHILERSKNRYTADQARSTVELMQKVAEVEGSANEAQVTLVEGVKRILDTATAPPDKWDSNAA